MLEGCRCRRFCGWLGFGFIVFGMKWQIADCHPGLTMKCTGLVLGGESNGSRTSGCQQPKELGD